MRFVKKCLPAAFAAALMVLPTSAMADPTPDAYYPFDDCALVSSTANAYNSGNPALSLFNGATLNGTSGASGSTCASSPADGSLAVNPGTSTYDDFAHANGSDDAVFRGVSSLTLAADVSIDNADNYWQTVALQDQCGTIHSNSALCIGYALFAQNDANGGKVPKAYVRYTYPSTPTQLVEVTGDSQLSSGFHSLAVTASGSGVKLYVDGSPVDSATETINPFYCDGEPSTDAGSAAGRFTVGGELITGSIDGLGYMNPNEVLHGLVDNLRFYDVELTGAEVANISL